MMHATDADRALELARSLGTIADPNERADRIEEIVPLAGLVTRQHGASLHDIAPLASFSPPQREGLRALAEHHGHLGTVRVVGVPIFEFDVRPWAGVAPPRTIDTEVARPDGTQPRWLVLQSHGLAKASWEEAAAVALEGLDAAGRLDVILSIAAGAYWLSKLFPMVAKPAAIEQALAAVGDPAFGYARALVDRLAAADSISRRFGMVRPEHLSPILRALHRAGHATPPALRALVAWDEASRPLLASIPADDREAMVLARIEKWGAPNLRALGGLEALADLLVTPAVVEKLRRIAAQAGELAEHADQLDALGARAVSSTRPPQTPR
jgi:hypothetical protein